MDNLTARSAMTGGLMIALGMLVTGITRRDFATGAWQSKANQALDMTPRDILTGAYLGKINSPTLSENQREYSLAIDESYDLFTGRNTNYTLGIYRSTQGSFTLTIDYSQLPSGLNQTQQIDWLILEINQQLMNTSMHLSFAYVSATRQIILTADQYQAEEQITIMQNTADQLATLLFGQPVYVEL
jgi:hypothetical protein